MFCNVIMISFIHEVGLAPRLIFHQKKPLQTDTTKIVVSVNHGGADFRKAFARRRLDRHAATGYTNNTPCGVGGGAHTHTNTKVLGAANICCDTIVRAFAATR